ncbi:sigma-70 RNA polymerase sigma factor region 4 domain-containing protein [Paenibacillus jiagnxiensis]|uniref:sigma-70 family RNA polymerase sigma factor n=1 Tax=Paenibacillus jiagnxiensis TaxID=3228926 RepID=UPI0033B3E924
MCRTSYDMPDEQMPIVNLYRAELRKIVWRLQYRARVERKREMAVAVERLPSGNCPHAEVEERIWLDQVLDGLPSSTGKRIMCGIYVEGQTERQIAAELHMSQQGVSRWKQRMLDHLRRTGNF